MTLSNLTGSMISFVNWEKFIRASTGSDKMKSRVIDFVTQKFNKPELLDSFMLGLSYGELLDGMKTPDDIMDFYVTIKLTRNPDNVPIVKSPDGGTVN